MNIGIIVYSQTGNTLQVANRVKERLIGEGHSVVLEQVTVVGGRTPKTKEFELEAKPNVENYDAIVFASYVEAFSLCAVMARYLKGIGSLEGKQGSRANKSRVLRLSSSPIHGWAVAGQSSR